MANTKISDEAEATALTGTEEIPGVQSAANVKITPTQIKTYAVTDASIGAVVAAVTGKTTPVDADTIPLTDSAATSALKKLSWANIKATLKTYFDTLYPSGSGTSSGTNTGDQDLSGLLSKSGGTMSGDIAMGSNKVTGLAAATGNGEAVRYEQITGLASLVNSAVALTDASIIDLTNTKHTLASSSATRTFTISYTGDDITIEVTLSATSATYTFPATALCTSEGVSSGDNTLSLSGVSGDKYIIAIEKIGSAYYVVSKNFGQ